MPMSSNRLLFDATLAAAALAGFIAAATAQIPGDKIKIGVLSDFSGPFADQVGTGSLVGAQLAAEDFAKEAGGVSVEIISADHQNKPDIGVAIARRWVDEEGVDAIVDLAIRALASLSTPSCTKRTAQCWRPLRPPPT